MYQGFFGLERSARNHARSGTRFRNTGKFNLGILTAGSLFHTSLSCLRYGFNSESENVDKIKIGCRNIIFAIL